MEHEIDGQIVTLPVEVRSAMQASATWLTSADAAQAMIDQSGLKVARWPGDRASVTIAAVRYLDNDLGPYHEVAVAVVVEPHDRPGVRPSMRRPTTYIHRLPVNQEFTCAAGRGIWGFPKWLTDIEISEDRRHMVTRLHDDGSHVLTLRVRCGGVPVPDATTEMTAYSFLDGELRATPWTNRARGMRLGPLGAELRLGTGHPMAEELRSLRLGRPTMHSFTRSMAATFGAASLISAQQPAGA